MEAKQLDNAGKKRRDFLKGAAAGAGAMTLSGAATTARAFAKRDFKISVAGWSLHKEVFGGEIKCIEAFGIMRDEFDIGAFELVNTMLEVPTASYVNRLRRESEKHEVVIPLIMVDAEGSLGGADLAQREKAVRDHAKWIYIAADLGCHSIRVNWAGAPRGAEKDDAVMREVIGRSVHAFAELIEIGQANGISIIIENHGGPSSYPDHLVALMKAVDSPHFGTLPDFGNFPDDVDRYDATEKMMPYAKAVSAKCYDFGPDGDDTKIDFEHMLKICIDDHGYHGFVGIEYEGSKISERAGIKAAKELLVKLRG